MGYKSEQEKFWAETYASDYIKKIVFSIALQV